MFGHLFLFGRFLLRFCRDVLEVMLERLFVSRFESQKLKDETSETSICASQYRICYKDQRIRCQTFFPSEETLKPKFNLNLHKTNFLAQKIPFLWLSIVCRLCCSFFAFSFHYKPATPAPIQQKACKKNEKR